MEYKFLYAAAVAINFLGWGLFYTAASRYIAIELNGGDLSVFLLTGLSWFFTLLGIISGKVVSVLGEKRALLIGVFQCLPLITGPLISDPYILSSVFSTISLPWVIQWSILLKIIFSSAGDRPGRVYGEITMGTGLGYAVGAAMTGPLYAVMGVRGVFTASAMLLSSPSLIYYLYYSPGYSMSPGGRGVVFVTRRVFYAYISLSLIVLVRETLYSLAPVKLNTSIGELASDIPEWLIYTLYGLIYSGGAILSPFTRILAGWIVDRYGPLNIYIFSIIGYTLLYSSFTKTSGLIPILLWQIPLFPFLDASFNVYIARKLDYGELVTGFGLTHTFTAIGGLLVLLVMYLRDMGILYLDIVIYTACITAVFLMLLNERNLRVDPGNSSM